MEFENYELKPCPFCGGMANFETEGNTSNHHKVGFDFKIKCRECGIKSPKRYRVYFILGMRGQISTIIDERQKAMDDWNRRANDERYIFIPCKAD